ncbi:hypothetical protein [Ancylomarina sp. 16SWW S1-10-2]|uniref:hypothetical protein n=1 Tax=Ancylomarina sp. 16SWW S1-10-2 TaxID=2499681 RepID=UPI0012ADCC58|nr:hypothetical protein [Ancylomarina sp. 16SWW S1-10-2]MRT93017.1 hypothetical protein [Ancylomarina sp. 16SWW S1-10-2]
MSKQNLPNTKNLLQEQLSIEAQIQALTNELEVVEYETSVFEASLRAILIDMIIEEQELSDLYRQMQKAKKEKRLEQRKRGKNYQEPKGLKISSTKEAKPLETDEDSKEKKRLYREAMLHVHPDKFAMKEDKIDLATEITSQLIQIYKTGSLADLQLYHNHIFTGNTILEKKNTESSNSNTTVIDSYLKHQKEELEKKLFLAKNRQTYSVLKDYENPMLFAEELKAYYTDRLLKLRKRTRKSLYLEIQFLIISNTNLSFL